MVGNDIPHHGHSYALAIERVTQPATVVTKRIPARAMTQIVTLDVVGLGARVVIVMHAGSRLGRIDGRNAGHGGLLLHFKGDGFDGIR